MASAQAPTISVVVPLYNKGGYVEEALRSVLSQTHPACEIIVVDDGSTDDGPLRVEAMRLPQVRLIRQPNSGVAAARNAGIAAAQGDYIAFLDADDRYLPDFLATIVALAADYPQAVLLGTGHRRFWTNGETLVQPRHRTVSKRGLVPDFYTAWIRSSFLFTSSLAVKRSAFADPTLRFALGERLGEDLDVWFKLAERFPVAYDPAIQSEYRMGVPDSAVNATPLLAPLPCYRRLAERLAAGMVPPALRSGARRLLASHFLTVAFSRARAKDISGALRLLVNPISFGKPLYWAKTAMRIGMAALKHHAGR